MTKLLAAFAFLFLGLSSQGLAQTAPADQQTHQELRALKDRLVGAVNRKDPKALLAELDQNVWFTAMNNDTFHGLDGARRYYDMMMVGSDRIVREMSLSATPDDLAILYANGQTAVSTGTSNAHFNIRGGAEFDVPLRWTATLVKAGDGRWKVASAHFSANMFDNPVMNGVKRFAYGLAAALAVLGLLVGWFIGRRTRRKAA